MSAHLILSSLLSCFSLTPGGGAALSHIFQRKLGCFPNIAYLCSKKDAVMEITTSNAIDNKVVLEFVTYCIGKLSAQLSLSQQEVYKRLKDSNILYGYIIPSYDVLHTFSSRYLMEDLTDYMKEKGVL